MAAAPEQRERIATVTAWAIAAAASVAYGLSFGFTYGVNNQTEYMLGALRKLDPSLLANDWLAAHTLNYHPAFAYLGWLLLAVGGRGGWAVGVATVVAASAGALSLHWLARRLLPAGVALPAFLLTVAAMLATGTRAMAGSYAFDPIFQPSAIGSVALLASLAPFVEGRWLLSGVLLAAGGLFHANYLVLGLATFGLAHLALGWKGIAARALRHLGPSLVVLAVLSPVIFRAVRGGTDVARAQEILFDIRSPHHYHPRSFIGEFYPFLAWQALGLAAGGWVFRRGDGRGRRFGAVILGLLAVVWIGSTLAIVFEMKRATQLFVWRFAPYLDVLMQLLVAATVVNRLLAPGLRLRLTAGVTGACFAGAAGLGIAMTGRSEPTRDWLGWMGGACALGVALHAIGPFAARMPAPVRSLATRAGPWVATAAAALLLALTVKPALDTLRARSNLLTGMPGAETDLYHWIAASTPKDAVFLSPPGLERFRLGSERAIVADWKGVTYAPGELLEWYHRLEELSGRRGLRSREEVVAGYDAMDRPRLERLREEYHPSYAVVGRGREGALGYRSVYGNGQFSVIDLRPDAAAPGPAPR